MSFKKKLKKILPNRFVVLVKKVKNNKLLKRAYFNDLDNYSRFSGISDIKNENQVNAKLIFYTHSIEKGLSHPNFRPRFGRRALSELNHYLTEFKYWGFNTDSMEYQNALSVLSAYDKKHRDLDINIPRFHKIFDKYEYSQSSDVAGSMEAHSHSSNMKFSELVNTRHSVREFDNSPVDMDKVKNAVQSSIRTPSVCNRQPWKVYITEDVKKIEELLEIQGGYKGYGNPPVLSLVAVDLSSFISVNERNEPFVDGGMFTMSFLYALTNEGLASCTLNTMSSKDSLNKIKSIMGISESEVLISFIAIGNYKNNYRIAKSHRKNLNRVLVFDKK